MARSGIGDGGPAATLRWRGRAVRGSLALAAFALIAGGSAAEAAQAYPNVVTYHNAADRSGVYTVPGLTWAAAWRVHMDAHFHATVNGEIYAQPLYWLPPGAKTGEVIVATQTNFVYALDATTGAEIWHRYLGAAEPSGSLPCGDIGPKVGITGTPVIDPGTGAIYVNALVDGAAGLEHLVYGLSLKTGAVQPGWPVDVAEGVKAIGQTFQPLYQEQRSALTVVHQELYLTYSGYDGDCGPYHGWAVGIALNHPKVAGAGATRAALGGIWGQSGIAFDGTSMFATTGNTSGASSWSDGEAVIRLAPDLKHSSGVADYFTPSNWLALDDSDLDLGGTAAIPVDVAIPKGTAKLIIALGKDGNAYALDRARLGGVGGALAIAPVSTDQIRTAAATYWTPDGTLVAFQGQGANCPGASGNLTVLRIAAAPAASITTQWCASVNGAGSPIVTTTNGSAHSIVWMLGAEGDNQLHGFRGTDGTALFDGTAAADQMTGLHHFQSFIAAENRFYVAADGRIYAFTLPG